MAFTNGLVDAIRGYLDLLAIRFRDLLDSRWPVISFLVSISQY